MTARTHDLAAITALAVAVVYVSIPQITLSTALLAILANLIGGIAPDIDQPTAPFWRNLPVGKYFGKIFDLLLGGHRFISHSILGILLFGFLSKLLLNFLHPIIPHINIDIVWWAFLIGYVSHLAIDTFTKEGVPWLLPIPFKFGIPPIKAWRITTGKVFETWLVIPLLIGVDLWLVSRHHTQILYLLHHIIN